MPLITWSDDLRTGVESIDEEHEALIGLMNEFYHALIINERTPFIREKLRMLTFHATAHFSHEEDMIYTSNYPKAHEHLKEHNDLRTQMMRLEAACEKGADDKLANEAFVFLKSWIMGHLIHEDSQLAEYLKEKGVR